MEQEVIMNNLSIIKWDYRFFRICDEVASWSKDPSTGFGAIIVDKYNRILGTGYNGFPRKVEYNDASRLERPKKYNFMVHAEANVVVQVGFERARGCRMYLSSIPPRNCSIPCCGCAGLIIQAGIVEVICKTSDFFMDASIKSTWRDGLIFAKEQLSEAGVILREL